MIPQMAVHEDHVVGPYAVGAHLHAAGDDADAGGVDEEPVGGAARHHLGIAGGHRPPRRPGGRPQAAQDAPQHLDGQALLDHQRAAQVERHRAAHGEIVHGAVDRQRADVAARELERRHHEGVGGVGQAVAAGRELGQVEARLVLVHRQRRAAELTDHQVVDQVAHGLAATAVGQVHHVAPHATGALARALDALEERVVGGLGAHGLDSSAGRVLSRP